MNAENLRLVAQMLADQLVSPIPVLLPSPLFHDCAASSAYTYLRIRVLVMHSNTCAGQLF